MNVLKECAAILILIFPLVNAGVWTKVASDVEWGPKDNSRGEWTVGKEVCATKLKFVSKRGSVDCGTGSPTNYGCESSSGFGVGVTSMLGVHLTRGRNYCKDASNCDIILPAENDRLIKQYHLKTYAGEYTVWYQGRKRSTNLIIKCDNSLAQPGIFSDALRTDTAGLSKYCQGSRDTRATMYILGSHGRDKFECMWADGDKIVGSHYMGFNRYYGTVEYRPLRPQKCADHRTWYTKTNYNANSQEIIFDLPENKYCFKPDETYRIWYGANEESKGSTGTKQDDVYIYTDITTTVTTTTTTTTTATTATDTTTTGTTTTTTTTTVRACKAGELLDMQSNACKDCPAGTFQPQELHSMTSCEKHAAKCRYNEHIAAPASATSNIKCASTEPCAAGEEFESERPEPGETDRECTPLTVCEPGQYEATAPSTRKDRKCASCDTSSRALSRGCTTSTSTRTTTTKTRTTRTQTSTTRSTTTATSRTTTTATTTSTTTTTTTTTSTTMLDLFGYLALNADEIINLEKTAVDMIDVGFTALDLAAVGFDPEIVVDATSTAGGTAQILIDMPGVTVELLKNVGGYSANDLRSYGISADALAAAGYTTSEVDASAAFAPAASSTTPIIIVVAAVLVVAIVAVVVILKRSKSGGDAGANGLASFENPMYDSVHGNNAGGGSQHADPNSNGITGYMDVPAGSGGGGQAQGASGYMDVSPNAGGGGQAQGASGYMDVSPNAGDGGQAQGASGYMDVSPNAGGNGAQGASGYMDISVGEEEV